MRRCVYEREKELQNSNESRHDKIESLIPYIFIVCCVFFSSSGNNERSRQGLSATYMQHTVAIVPSDVLNEDYFIINKYLCFVLFSLALSFDHSDCTFILSFLFIFIQRLPIMFMSMFSFTI